MEYCKNCQRLVEGPVCKYCRNTKLRAPLDADFCMAAELPYYEAAMLKELFDDNGIPCTERSVYGAGITVKIGANLDRVRLYVPYEKYPQSQELFEAFFNSPLITDGSEPEGEPDMIPKETPPDPPRKAEVGRIYRHFKGNLYRVEGVAKHSETLEEYVVYRQMYGDESLWVRPAEMFLSPIDKEKYPDAMQKFRFEPVDPDSAKNPDAVK